MMSLTRDSMTALNCKPMMKATASWNTFPWLRKSCSRRLSHNRLHMQPQRAQPLQQCNHCTRCAKGRGTRKVRPDLEFLPQGPQSMVRSGNLASGDGVSVGEARQGSCTDLRRQQPALPTATPASSARSTSSTGWLMGHSRAPRDPDPSPKKSSLLCKPRQEALEVALQPLCVELNGLHRLLDSALGACGAGGHFERAGRGRAAQQKPPKGDQTFVKSDSFCVMETTPESSEKHHISGCKEKRGGKAGGTCDAALLMELLHLHGLVVRREALQEAVRGSQQKTRPPSYRSRS